MANGVRTRRAARVVASGRHKRFGVFISYSTENESLAKKLKDKIQILDDANRLDVFIASELGGQKWRQTIQERLATAQILLLPYPNKTMKLDWVCYELGRFHANGIGKAVCIMNTQLDNPPDQMAEWQAYRADNDDLRKFFVDLFRVGAFTNKVAINRNITDERYRTRLDEAVRDIEAEFAAFRLTERYYTSRIEIRMPALHNRLPAKLNFDQAVVVGNEQTLAIFGVESGASWRFLKERCNTSHSSAQWTSQVERSDRLAANRQLAGTLVPFRTDQHRTFIPLVSKIETIENELSQVNVVFVELGNDVRLPMERHAGFDRMPPSWKAPFSLLEIGRRFRFTGLDPAMTAVRFPQADAPQFQWVDDAKGLLQAIAEGSTAIKEVDIHGADSFFSVFDPDLRRHLGQAFTGWPDAESELRQAIDQRNRKQAMQAIERMSRINAIFLSCTVQQAARLVAGLNPDAGLAGVRDAAPVSTLKGAAAVAEPGDVAAIAAVKDAAAAAALKDLAARAP